MKYIVGGSKIDTDITGLLSGLSGCKQDKMFSPCHPGSLWVPPGKTLGDIIHWVDLSVTGKVKGSDVINGMRLFQLYGADGEPRTREEIEKARKLRASGLWTLRRDGVWVPPFRK